MDRIIYRISLDCQRSGAQRFIEGLVQGDVSSRRIVISLTQNGESVTLADNNLVAVMNCHNESHPCEIKDNQVIYDFQASDYNKVGESIYQLMIMTAESPRRVLFTPSFYVNVADADGDFVGSDEEYSALMQAIAEARTVYETRLTDIVYEEDGTLLFRYADGRELVIDTLKEVLEQERDRDQRFGDMSQDFDSWTATEDARQSAEAQRVLAERIRVNDEYQRGDNEGNRMADEQLRQEAERERKKAEAQREETMNSYLEDMNVALADASTAINKMNEILQNDFPTPDEQMEWTEAYGKVRDVRKSEVDYLHGITSNTSFSGGTIADKFDSVYAKTNSIEATHSAYEQRMDGVVDQMNGRIGENSYKTNSLDTRVTRLEQSGGGSDVPIATTEVAGKVKPDGSTITVDTDGTIHAVGGGGGGTSDYNALSNKPKVNGVTLSGNKDFRDLGLDSYIQEHHEELKGDDGFSPSASVERVSDGAVITITDKSGTTTAKVNDGQGGGGGSKVKVEEGFRDTLIIPDKYNTGCDESNLIKFYEWYPTQDKLNISRNYPAAGDVTFNYRNNSCFKDSDETVFIVENVDFTHLDENTRSVSFQLYVQSSSTKDYILIFRNCRFGRITNSYPKQSAYEYNRVEFYNCDMLAAQGANYKLDNCKIGGLSDYHADFGDKWPGVTGDLLNCQSNVFATNCYIYDPIEDWTDRGYSGTGHLDGMQLITSANTPYHDVIFDNCRMEMPYIVSESGYVSAAMNVCWFPQAEHDDSIVLRNSYINGGAWYTFQANEIGTYENVLYGGSANKVWHSGTHPEGAEDEVLPIPNLYVSAVIRTDEKISVICTNDTRQDRTLRVVTNKGEKYFPIKKCSVFNASSTLVALFEDMPIDVECQIDDDGVEYVICYDVTDADNPVQIRFVNYTGKDVYIDTDVITYEMLPDKPSINGVVLEGNKTSEELGITGTTYTAGFGIAIEGGVISVNLPNAEGSEF